MPARGRIREIDTIRGFAVLAVVLTHIGQLISSPGGKFLQDSLPGFLHTAIFKSGYYGVVVFFVVSGFLITDISLQRWGSLDRIPAARFYKLRIARVLPNLLGIILVLLCLHALGVSGFQVHTEKTSLLRATVAAIGFHVNWIEAFRGGLPMPWLILWSLLAVEEVFYLCFPIVCRISRKTAVFLIFMGVFIALGPPARTVFSDAYIWRDHGYLSGMDAIAFGCVAAVFVHPRTINHLSCLAMKFAGWALVGSSFLFNGALYKSGLGPLGLNVSYLAIGTGLLLISLVSDFRAGREKRGLYLTPIQWFGRLSYEVYLTHLLIIVPLVGLFSLDLYGPLRAGFGFPALIAACGILGMAIFRWYSEPLNQLLRRSRWLS